MVLPDCDLSIIFDHVNKSLQIMSRASAEAG